MARNNVSPARWVAFEILRKVEAGHFSSVLLAADTAQLEPTDRALCHELVLGVLRWQLYLDHIIEHFSKRKISSLDLDVVLALRLGLYQLRFLTRVPQSAAVNESVKIVQAARLSSARAFVNALLRRATREAGYDPATEIVDPIEKLSVQASHPQWLIQKWANAFGLEETAALARANNETPIVAFRVLGSSANEEDVLARLSRAGIAVEPSKIARRAFRTPAGSRAIRELAENGEIYLQDEASQLVAEKVAAQDGERVLDVCSAPGGKTTSIADQQGTLVVAGDVSKRRLATVARAVGKQKLKNVALAVLDASKSLPFAKDLFDKVLLDAPCSGTGTLRHNPEIRWRLKPDEFEILARQQKQFLVNSAEVVKPGGRLVYSTCSLEREENEEVVEWFLKSRDDFQAISSETVRTWPHRDETDGFYVAVLKKL
ncbi:MAG TPA: 16S rRNA (cytosine(967)-C(5))-methyltransferase RsmB [Pyrinomonadaceae bacterium]